MLREVGLWMNRHNPWPARIVAGAGLLLVGAAAGLVAAGGGLLTALGLLAGLALFVAGFYSPWLGLLLTTAVVFLLPFGVLPLRLGLTPSFLELALLGTLAGWVLPLFLHPQRQLRFQSPDGLAWAFIALTFFSLIVGLGRGVNATVLHNYGKTVLALLAFWTVRQLHPTAAQRRHFIAWLLLLAGLSALLGLLLHALPDSLARDLLTGLGPLGYPTSGRVLRYVEDDPQGLERAIGTAVDPNSFGGALAFAAAIALGEALAGWAGPASLSALLPRGGPGPQDRRQREGAATVQRRVLPQPLLLLILVLLLACLYLTYSRAALGGFVVAALFLATARYRRLWWGIVLLALIAALLVAGPAAGHPVVERFRQGIAFQDLANRMRLAEYASALAIIQRYPVFGVGLAQAPEVDLTTGVSSLYLTIAERMGLVGLLAFLAFLGTVGVWALRAYRRAEGEQAGHILALSAGLLAALSSGLLDHYFFHLEFPHMAALLWMTLGLVSCSSQSD